VGYQFLQAALVAFACCTDCLATGFAYGVNKIKIRFLPALIINVVCALFLGVSLFLGSVLSNYISLTATKAVSATVLIILGLVKICESVVKNWVRRKAKIEKNLNFSIFSLQFMLKIYANPENADKDNSKELSVKEAIPLAIALSLDNVAIGLGAGLANLNTVGFVAAIGITLVAAVAFLIFGRLLGNKIANKTTLNLAWISGLILIGLAVLNVI
jgi:putative sporulation protein YtaF